MNQFTPVLFLVIVSSTLPLAAEVDFAHEVVPLINKHCIECHTGDKAKGGLSMDTKALLLEADVIELGKPEKSLMIEVVTSDDPDEKMPPPEKKKAALNTKEIDVLKRWISAGVPWTEGFTFAKERYEPPLKPRTVKLPKGPAGANPIDLILAEHFKKKGQKFPEAADNATFLRRVSADLNGLPPSADMLAKISAADFNKSKTVDELLANKEAYAVHWMTFWNDLLRNEYAGTGFITGGRKQVTAWLYPSLLENKPYNQFVTELVSPDANSAGFINGIEWRGEVNASQTLAVQFSQNVSQVFLGINMKCASCHDSFVDRWTLIEAYGLAAIYSDKPLELTRCDKPTGEKAVAAWLYPELGQIDPSKPKPERLKQLASLITHPENGRMQRTLVNRLWNQMMGRGIVHPVDAMNTEPWNEDLLDLLANYLVESNYDMKAVIRLIATSRIYQARADVLDDETKPFVFNGPVRKRMTAEQFIDSARATVGVWPKPDKNAFNGGNGQGGQLNVVMKSHGLEKWDDRPIRTAFLQRDSLQAVLGRPNREQVVTSRPDQLTTLEAINLANGPELAGLIREGAQKIGKVTDPKSTITQVYATSLSRKPTTREMEVAQSMLGTDPQPEQVEDFLWSIFMLPEFFYIN
ncbi:MAG: PSD1 and planctomycete cytochrome C domain-containing protein [Akkermansiaceae bacterium]